MKKKIALFLTAALLLCLVGCGKEAAPETLPDFNEAPSAPAAAPVELPIQAQPAPEGNPTREALYASDNLIGDVYEAAGNGCILLPYKITKLGDGELCESGDVDDPGDWKQVRVQYGPDCAFVTANCTFDSEDIRFTDATAADIQKGSSLVVYGEFTAENVVTAQRVYITVYSEHLDVPAPVDHPALGEGDGELLSGKNIQGVIYQVTSENSCIFFPDTVDDLGNGMTVSGRASQDEFNDPGDWPQVPIQYDPDCGFYSATIHFNDEKRIYEGVYADTTPAVFRPLSQLVVYGDYDEAGVLHAQRIYHIIWDR